MWAVARGFRLGNADAADVAQATWLRLVEHMGQIRDANRLGAWLATTARREALGVLRRAGHNVPAGDMGLLDTVEEPADSPENRLLRTERDTQLWLAFRRLGGDCQRLLRILLAEPKPTLPRGRCRVEHAGRQHRPDPGPVPGRTSSPAGRLTDHIGGTAL